MLSQLLRHQLRDYHEEGSVDTLESAEPYRRWAPAIRTLTRLRYLREKRRLLEHERDELRYAQDMGDVHQGVRQQLGPNESVFTPGTVLFRPLPFYGLLLLILTLLIAAALYSWQNTAELRFFQDAIPRYSDSVYVWKAEQERDPDSAQLAALETEVKQQRQHILSFHSGTPELQWPLLQLLDAVRSNSVEPAAMLPLVKAVNDALFERGIGFYISAVSERAPCSFLPGERFLERLFGAAQASEELCLVHALLTFTVDEARYYQEQQNRHLTLFTRRYDQLKIDEAVLGRVHIGDNTAQVLLSNIAGASNSSLTAINNGTLQAKLMPQGMTDVYGLESLARRLQARVISQYVDDIEQHWTQRFRALWFEITGRRSNPLALAARRLEQRLADVTAFHEVQHLVDQSLPLAEPPWFGDAVAVFGKRIRNEDFRKHILWELSAFFTHLANADELQGVLLNDFTAITLNPMLQDQPHFYSVRILLPILHQMARDGVASPTVPALTLAEVALAYKALAANPDDLGRLAREAYPVLFKTELPDLTPESTPKDWVGHIRNQLRQVFYTFRASLFSAKS